MAEPTLAEITQHILFPIHYDATLNMSKEFVLQVGTDAREHPMGTDTMRNYIRDEKKIAPEDVDRFLNVFHKTIELELPQTASIIAKKLYDITPEQAADMVKSEKPVGMSTSKKLALTSVAIAGGVGAMLFGGRAEKRVYHAALDEKIAAHTNATDRKKVEIYLPEGLVDINADGTLRLRENLKGATIQSLFDATGFKLDDQYGGSALPMLMEIRVADQIMTYTSKLYGPELYKLPSAIETMNTQIKIYGADKVHMNFFTPETQKSVMRQPASPAGPARS